MTPAAIPTPGPWCVSCDDDMYIREEASDYIIASISDGGHPEVELFGADTQGANAQLIAAAPELLAALQNVMSWIDNWFPNFAEDDEWPADRDRARAVILKAAGEAVAKAGAA